MTIDSDYDSDYDDAEREPGLGAAFGPQTEPQGDQTPVETIGEPASHPEQLVEVRRRTGLAASLGAGASLVAVAYLARAAAGGGALDWVVGGVLAMVGVAYLVSLLDARTPLLVADELGVRLRLGRTWVGLPWGGIDEVELQGRRRWWRDGLLTVRTHYVQRVLEDLDPGARRLARVNRRLHHAPLALPLGLGTRVLGGRPDLAAALRTLSAGRAPVTEVVPQVVVEADVEVPELLTEPVLQAAHRVGEPDAVTLPEPVVGSVVEPVVQPVVEQVVEPVQPVVQPVDQPVAESEGGGLETRGRRLPDPRPAMANLIGVLAARLERGRRSRVEALDVDDAAHLLEELPSPPPEILASPTPAPSRATVAARRTEVRHEVQAPLPGRSKEDPPLGAPFAEDEPGEDTRLWSALADVPLLLDDEAPIGQAPAPPVIGPQLAAARERLGLDVDELADRTRIRPHVIEAIEVDDFAACGGDFYARGHLRTLGRVLGVEAAPMLVTYDEQYADAPIDPRRVFEAELAGAGSMRSTRGGPNWSVLVAAVMALVLCWSVARLVTGGPGRSPDVAVLSGSGGTHHSRSVLSAPVPVTLTAAGGGARVVVHDGLGKLVFAGDLSYGQKRTVHVSAPVRIQSTDGSVRVTVDGKDRGRMGPAGHPTSRTYH
ncbi:MAG TPA: helix-turn-helix domain-containing protein [Nocardioides sp.]|uniref:helix-turn-helix domain-containing protein n=1 Tax=Nocardioides sp. TaxID=35761 RepID=UPI002E3744BA|nr:helix-turn-helix domain-containing protein [Nocardioides sp.]HEX3929087.1 helix-turn-helix domain-containing protein [Nocardioides sp.]